MENIKMETETTFQPQAIGEPNVKAATKAKMAYTELTEKATILKKGLESLLTTEFSIEKFLEFARAKEPEKWIFRAYIEISNINFPGLSIEKILDLNLVDLDVSPILPLIAEFKKSLEKVKDSGFYNPLRELWFEDDGFFSDAEIWPVIDGHFTRYTQTAEQNQILDIFNRLAGNLNELAALRILRPEHGPNELNFISEFIEISDTIKEPTFVVNDILFWKHRLRNYLVKNTEVKKSSFGELLV